jgi:ABC-type Na+ efflux pump permease subunit
MPSTVLKTTATSLVIARRELTRLRSRFSGRTQPIVLGVLALVLIVTYAAYRQQGIRGRGLYTIGVAPGGPVIDDPRFRVLSLPATEGHAALAEGLIDVYIDGPNVIPRDADKAQYALGALRLYLETAELARIADTYADAEGFPFRVSVTSFPISQDTAAARPREILIPSLMQPPMPFAGVLKASLHLFPIFLVSVFFTSGLMEERRERRISVLLAAPISSLEIILGKVLPYLLFALAVVMVMALMMGGNPLLAGIIFIPIICFILSVTLMVPLIYRSFADTTFISMFVTVATTLYLVFPAMLLGLSDLSYISPLSLAVEMYQGRGFTLRAYLTAALPMFLMFGFFVYVGSRILNEEYLSRHRPIYRKLAEAVYMAIDRQKPYLSTFLVSLGLIPVVYLIQLVALTFSLNFPLMVAIGGVLAASVVVEEIVKSVTIVMLIEDRRVEKVWQVVLLALLSALGFLLGEKFLLFVSIRSASESLLAAVILNAGSLWITFVAHWAFTSIAALLSFWLGSRRYLYALMAASLVHLLYNLSVLGVLSR